MTVMEYLRKHPTVYGNSVRPHIHCKDGYVLSVQASDGHYCLPRKNNAEEYDAVEVMLVTGHFVKGWGRMNGSVYGFVPIDKVEKLVSQHGGIVDNE